MLNNKQSGTAAINGTQMYYEVAGSGHPLIMVHAGIADNRMWDDQFNVFAEMYRVIRFDQRGYGQTAPIAGEYRRYQDIYALLKFLGIEQTYLLGCSMGGGACIDFALEHPDMAKALITVGSSAAGFTADVPKPPIWEALAKADEAGDLEQVAEYEAQLWLDGPNSPAGRVGGAVRQKMMAMNRIALQNEQLDLGEHINLDPPAVTRLDQLKLPMLIIYGDLDTPFIQAAGQHLAQHVSGAKRIVMSGVAHLPNMEQPSLFNQHILTFLSTLSS